MPKICQLMLDKTSLFMARASCRIPSGFLRHVLRHYPDLPTAVSAARRNAHPGDTILLAPGCTSYDQFPSYGARGDAFRALASTP